MAKEILAAFGVDVDAVAGWIGSYGRGESPSDIQRGVWAGEVGTPRLLKLFERYGIRTSWFIPGHSIETFPDQWVYRELDYAVFPFTIHPDVSGRPRALLMLERLIEYVTGHDGVRWATMEEIAAEFRTRFPLAGSARPRDW